MRRAICARRRRRRAQNGRWRRAHARLIRPEASRCARSRLAGGKGAHVGGWRRWRRRRRRRRRAPVVDATRRTARRSSCTLVTEDARSLAKICAHASAINIRFYASVCWRLDAVRLATRARARARAFARSPARPLAVACCRLLSRNAACGRASLSALTDCRAR